MEQVRTVYTPKGPMPYVLIRKRVKNWNLHITPMGEVHLSAPLRCSAEQADRFVLEKWSWIEAHRTRQEENRERLLPPEPSREICLTMARAAVERVYPRVRPLGVEMPQIRVRRMKSQWGNCHWSQGYITLNLALFRCPAHLQEYVALHELVHFLHHNHGPGFYEIMDRLMPDWKQCRQELKGYVGAIQT